MNQLELLSRLSWKFAPGIRASYLVNILKLWIYAKQ